MNQQPKILKMLEEHRGERHLIVLHNFPDPDAISSAYAQRVISEEYEIDTVITYTGKISHRQNIALVKLLGIDLVPYSPEMDMHQFQGAIFVDNQGTTVPEIVRALDEAHVPILLVVDHHEAQNLFEPECEDIRRVGATATIYATYLQQGVIPMDSSRRDIVMMTTALMHGIMTDTNTLIRAGSEDFQAAAFLSRYRDADLLSQIMAQARSKAVLELIRRALGDRLVVENYSIAGMGYLRSDDRDAIPQAADFLLSEENVHTAIVYGIIRDSDSEETLTGSMRTAKITIDPDEFLKEVFGKSAEGRFYGGGKTSAGGFSIPIGFLAGEGTEKYQETKWSVYDAQIKRKILAKIGVDHDLVDEKLGVVERRNGTLA